MSEAQVITPGQYIEHHLEHLTLNLKTFSIGDGGGFWTLNLDTLIVSVLIGIVVFGTLRMVATRLTEVPGKMQNLVEMVFEFVNNAVHEIFHHKTTFTEGNADIPIWPLSFPRECSFPID